jgi:hypothetical protein
MNDRTASIAVRTMIAAPKLMLSFPEWVKNSVMAGLVPAIHVLLRHNSKTWMAVTSTAVTVFVVPRHTVVIANGQSSCRTKPQG